MERTDWEAEMASIADKLRPDTNPDLTYITTIVSAAHAKAVMLQGRELQRAADALEKANEPQIPPKHTCPNCGVIS